MTEATGGAMDGGTGAATGGTTGAGTGGGWRPTGRVVVFGATGYTGDLVARALVRDGARPVLAGRNGERLARLGRELGGAEPLEHRVADVADPASVHALVGPGDVLVTTVGPFNAWGAPAVEAATAAGAAYLDSTGEGPFIRRVFEEYGPRARTTGAVLLTAAGYDYFPGNLAAAIALERVASGGRTATAVDVGYFLTGRPGRDGMSGGTRASTLRMVGAAGYGYRDGALREERPGAHVLRFVAGGRRRPTVNVPATEQFALPRLAPSLRRVRVGNGWFGPLSPVVAGVSRGAGLLDAVPAVRSRLGRLAGTVAHRYLEGSSGGPDAAARARSGSLVVADAFGPDGELLAHVELAGPNGYTLTGELMAWAARTAAAGGLQGAGALGPVEAFGLDALRLACAGMGLVESLPASPSAPATPSTPPTPSTA